MRYNHLAIKRLFPFCNLRLKTTSVCAAIVMGRHGYYQKHFNDRIVPETGSIFWVFANFTLENVLTEINENKKELKTCLTLQFLDGVDAY